MNPSSPNRVIAYTSATIPPVPKAAPTAPSRPVWRSAPTRVREPSSTSRPIGTLMKNTHRQPSVPVSTPPSSSPTTMPSPDIAP